MKSTYAITLAILLVAAAANAEGLRKRIAGPSPEEIRIVFVNASTAPSSGHLDTGSVSHARHGRGAGRSVVVRRIGIRLESPAGTEGGTASLRARLEAEDPETLVRIDGIVLDQISRIIDLRAPIGVTAFHTLEIEVSTRAQEGAFTSTIVWEAGLD